MKVWTSFARNRNWITLFVVSVAAGLWVLGISYENFAFCPTQMGRGSVWSVFSSVLFHDSFGHFVFDAIAFLVFGSFIEWRVNKLSYLVLLFCIASLSGLGYGLTRDGCVIGLSAINHGLLGAIIGAEFQTGYKGWGLLVLAIVVFKILGECLGVFILPTLFLAPTSNGAAFGAHLFGLFAGLLWALRQRIWHRARA